MAASQQPYSSEIASKPGIKSKRHNVILILVLILVVGVCASMLFVYVYDSIALPNPLEQQMQELEQRIIGHMEKGRDEYLSKLRDANDKLLKDIKASGEQSKGKALDRVEKTNQMILETLKKVIKGGGEGAASGTPEGQLSLEEAKRLLQFKQEEAYSRMLGRRSAHYKEDLPHDEFWAYFYYTPMYNCLNEERVGEITDGGKWVCDPTSLNSSSIVYSIGSNGDPSFELDLFSLCNGCQIHTFDMTVPEERMFPVRQAEEQGALKFHPYGLSVEEDPAGQTKGIKQIMAELGHTYIDVFKIDCEGCEWDFFDNIMKSFPPVLFGQVLVELHPFWTEPQTNKFFKGMESHGYRIFHYEVNPDRKDVYILEICFIHESRVKPRE